MIQRLETILFFQPWSFSRYFEREKDRERERHEQRDRKTEISSHIVSLAIFGPFWLLCYLFLMTIRNLCGTYITVLMFHIYHDFILYSLNSSSAYKFLISHGQRLTVILQLAQYPWQPEDFFKWNLCYMSHRIDKKNYKIGSKRKQRLLYCITLLFIIY